MSTTFDHEVSVLIDGQRFRFWSEVSIRRSIDGIDTLDLSGPFDPSDPAQRETFRPFRYAPIQVLVNDEPLFTGIMSTVNPQLSPDSIQFSVGAYSRPGELARITVPGNKLPTQYKQQNLHEIAETLCGFFDIEVTATVSPGPRFKKVKLDPGSMILPFLVDLSQKRGQIIGSTSTGELLFQTAITSGPAVAYLEHGLSPLIAITPALNPEEYYSEITGLKSIRPRSKSTTNYTARNVYLENVLRPHVFKIDNAEVGSIADIVNAKLSRMFANAIAYTLEVATWSDASGALWAPNTVVRVLAPGAMIYKPYDFIVRSVELRRNASEEVASLDVMVPGSFNDTEIGALPWAG